MRGQLCDMISSFFSVWAGLHSAKCMIPESVNSSLEAVFKSVCGSLCVLNAAYNLRQIATWMKGVSEQLHFCGWFSEGQFQIAVMNVIHQVFLQTAMIWISYVKLHHRLEKVFFITAADYQTLNASHLAQEPVGTCFLNSISLVTCLYTLIHLPPLQAQS